MAHEVQTMAYVDAVPWHGLGNQLTPKQTIEIWQREAGRSSDARGRSRIEPRWNSVGIPVLSQDDYSSG